MVSAAEAAALPPIQATVVLPPEREGRLEDAMDAWRTIIDWAEARGYALDALWPKQELKRLYGLSIES